MVGERAKTCLVMPAIQQKLLDVHTCMSRGRYIALPCAENFRIRCFAVSTNGQAWYFSRGNTTTISHCFLVTRRTYINAMRSIPPPQDQAEHSPTSRQASLDRGVFDGACRNCGTEDAAHRGHVPVRREQACTYTRVCMCVLNAACI